MGPGPIFLLYSENMASINVSSSGEVEFLGKTYKGALGKSGVVRNKKEGDLATPVGCFQIREIFYRSDRLSKPETVLPVRPLEKNDGWCDDIENSSYNKLVKLPYDADHERMWREDHLYDIVVVLGYNDEPVISGKGSGIFMHVAREAYSPTVGCVALAQTDLLEILKAADDNTLVCVNE